MFKILQKPYNKFYFRGPWISQLHYQKIRPGTWLSGYRISGTNLMNKTLYLKGLWISQLVTLSINPVKIVLVGTWLSGYRISGTNLMFKSLQKASQQSTLFQNWTLWQNERIFHEQRKNHPKINVFIVDIRFKNVWLIFHAKYGVASEGSREKSSSTNGQAIRREGVKARPLSKKELVWRLKKD